MLLIAVFFVSIVTCSLLMTLLLRSSNPAQGGKGKGYHAQQQQHYTPEPNPPLFVAEGQQERASDERIYKLGRMSQDCPSLDTFDYGFVFDKKLTNSNGKTLGLDEVREVLQSVTEDQVDECQALLSSIDYDLDELRELEATLCPDGTTSSGSLRHSWAAG